MSLSELKECCGTSSEQCVNAVKNTRVVRCLSTDLSDTERDTWRSSSLAHHCPHLEVPPHGTNWRESRALSLVPVGLRLVYLRQRQLQRWRVGLGQVGHTFRTAPAVARACPWVGCASPHPDCLHSPPLRFKVIPCLLNWIGSFVRSTDWMDRLADSVPHLPAKLHWLMEKSCSACGWWQLVAGCQGALRTKKQGRHLREKARAR